MKSLEFRCRHRYASGFELDLSFGLERRVTSLFGPSGSGKTSVLSLIAGFLRPEAGRIAAHDGERLLLDTVTGVCLPPEQRNLGFVFQDHLLFPHLTVERNLIYGATRPRAGGREVQRPISLRGVVEVLELGGLLRRYPRQLSGGESQRVALGRALMCAPDMLLLDEPLASLDEALKDRVLTYLERAVAEWNLPALFVSHAQSDVRRLADWVIVIRNGRLVAQGTPAEALGQPEILGLTNSAAPSNLLRIEEVHREEGSWQGRFGTQRLVLPLSAAPESLPLFVRFSPRDVIVCLQDVTGVSARNHVRGVVRDIVETTGGTFVAIDAGQMFWAEVTAAAVTELQLRPGSEVTCLIKTHSLEVVR